MKSRMLTLLSAMTWFAVLALAIMLVPAILAGSAEAQTYTQGVLHAFTAPPDGAAPHADVVEDAKGNLYSTTMYGGDSACNPPYGCGTAFKVDASGNESVLHTFTGPPDGNAPMGGLVLDAKGNLYGTTATGGTSNDGTVFKLDTTTGAETVLHSFAASPDGAWPESSSLLLDAKGNLYGATKQGGANSSGAVFKVDASGNESVLYSFAAGLVDPGNSVSALDAQGNLYGTTWVGGDSACDPPDGCGTVFKLDTAGNMTVLYDFTGTAGDGANPGKLGLDAQGNLYGTAYFGGDLACNAPNGCGIVYKLAPPAQSGGAWTETVLYTFTGGAGGYNPGGLMRDPQGNLYGGTGGGDLSCDPPDGCGMVWKLAPPAQSGGTWTETVLYTFTNEADGFAFEGGLRDAHGNLYLTAEEGGDLSCTTGPGGQGQPLIGCGTLSKLTLVAATKTTTTLSSSPNPSAYGQAVTFTAVVTSSKGAPPDGETVSFMKGKTVLGTGTLSGGTATYSTSTLKVGTDSITAVYAGDANFATSTSKADKQVVDKTATTTKLASSQNPSSYEQSVTFTATVTPQFSGTVTGKVSFYDGTTLLKSVALSGGKAKYTTKTLAVGAHTITATYAGSTDYTSSSASLTQTVN